MFMLIVPINSYTLYTCKEIRTEQNRTQVSFSGSHMPFSCLLEPLILEKSSHKGFPSVHGFFGSHS